ncbi:MAG TPA: YciI family protein [Gaiellaceae bacterium]|nr:YciI family protein [Gaiellaceae bacterium]
MELESYTFVLLRRGPRADELGDDVLEQLQAGHLRFLDRMRDDGHMLLSGPFRDQEDETKRGFSLYRTSVEETKRLIAEGDPSVRAGRMSVEVMTWLTKKGALG